MRAKKRKRVCVIVPAFNESTVIGGLINEIHSSFRRSNYSYEIVIIDDASTDKTYEICSGLQNSTTIKHLVNSGAGAATRTGLLYAKKNDFDIAVTIDGDGQHKPEDAAALIDYLIEKSADLVIGNRLENSQGMPAYKILGNIGLSLITRVVLGVSVKDSQSGLRAYSKKAISSLHFTNDRYSFCSEMIWRAKNIGLTIKEHPIEAIYTQYSTQKVRGQSSWGALDIVRNLISLRVRELFDE